MVNKVDIANATADSQDTAIADVTVSTQRLESPGPQQETKITNEEFTKWYGYFLTIPELHSALIMKSIWTVGKGYETKDSRTKVTLKLITGNGKQTFRDILFNADLVKNMNGRSYTEIIRNTTGRNEIMNLKNLNPELMAEIYNMKGVLIGYDYSQANGKIHRFPPDKIFHLINCGLGMGGVSRIKPLEETCKAMNETFTDMKYLMHHQAKPIILFKLKTDNTTKINAFIKKMDTARDKGRDMYIPDDENILSYEVLQVNPSQMVLQWIESNNNRFYRGVGMPLVLFGQAGQNESGGKIEFTGHGQVWEHDQKYIEEQVKAQLGLEIDLIHPESLLQNLQTDEKKDANQGQEIQKNDVTAGSGRDKV